MKKRVLESGRKSGFRPSRTQFIIAGVCTFFFVILFFREAFGLFLISAWTGLYDLGVSSLSSSVAQILFVIVFSILFLTGVATVSWMFYEKVRLKELSELPPTPQEVMQALAVSARQLQLLYDNGPVPYFIMDDEGNVRNPNKATTRFFGFAPDGKGVTNLFDLIAGVRGSDTRESIDLFVEKIKRGIAVSDEEIVLKTLRGAERIVLVSIYSVEKDSPLLYKHLVAFHDVTEDRESERIKTDFLLLASHQLRTPTTAIKWHTDYLLGTDSVQMDDTVREYLHEIYNANERMMDLVATLLTVSRVEMGILAPEYVRIDCRELIDDVLHELSPNIAKKRHHVDVSIPENATVYADRTMLRVAIHNLLTNAIKYTASGGTISITVTGDQKKRTITVTDTGYGIPASEQNRIFSKMFRASNAKKISADGTGLGLYLTRSFIEKLGGVLTFTSEEGKGTAFVMHLPQSAGEQHT